MPDVKSLDAQIRERAVNKFKFPLKKLFIEIENTYGQKPIGFPTRLRGADGRNLQFDVALQLLLEDIVLAHEAEVGNAAVNAMLNLVEQAQAAETERAIRGR